MSSGSISFGLVNIPVKVYSASDSGSRVSFNQLHAKCKGRLKQQMFCPTDNEVVPREDIVKGYEFAKDQYVIFTEEELDALEQAVDKTIEIAEFIPLSSIDPLFFDTGYYLGPDKGADRAFGLLATALTEMGHAAVASHVARGRQSLVLLRPVGAHLVMQQLRYADEVRSAADVPVGTFEVKAPELELAKQFIRSLSSEEFHPEKYTDSYRQRLLDAIDQKVKGEAITLAPSKPAEAKIVDLMEALKASLAKAGKAPAKREAAGEAARAGEAPLERKPPKRAPSRGGEAKERAKQHDESSEAKPARKGARAGGKR